MTFLYTTMVEEIIGPGLGGINNRANKSRMPLSQNGSPSHVRNATNLQVNNEGTFSSIDAPELVISGIGFNDGWSCQEGAFFRVGTTVKQFVAPDQSTTILEGVTGDRIAWGYHQGIVYFSDGIISKKLYSDGELSNWGIAAPTTAPLLSGTNIYGAGQFMACYTYIAADGRESGSSPVVIAESGGTVSGILSSPDPQAVAIKIFLTEPDGSTFFHAATVIPGDSSVTITDDYRANGVLQTRNKIAPLPSTIIRPFGAHILFANGNRVWWTDEWSTDLVSLGEEVAGVNRVNYWAFPVEPIIVEPVEGGVWVVADSTYFVAGKSPTDAEPIIVSENTAVKYTSYVDSSGNALWMSDDGEVVGSPGGQLSKPQEQNVAVDRAVTGATVEIDRNGVGMKVTTLVDPESNPLRSRDWTPFGVTSNYWE